jgi:uncharacterized protein (TIGR02679 family)
MEQEFVNYVISKEYLHRFMELWKKQYIRLGKLGGSILLIDVSIKEKEALTSLLGIYFNTNDIKITYRTVSKELQKTKYRDIDFIKVLELYFKETIVTNKIKRITKEELFFKDEEEIYNRIENTKAKQWLLYCQKDNPITYKKIIHLFQQDQDLVVSVFKAINALPLWHQDIKSISIFANEITNNPHYFDKGVANTLVFQSICYFLSYQKNNYTLVEKNTIWAEAGLIREVDVNYCMVYNLHATNKEKEVHLGLQYFTNMQEAINLHVENMQGIERFYETEKIVVIENPSVFRYLVSKVKEKKITRYGFICTNGELNYAGYLLLDIVYASAIPMLYCGDFDPEGILIADKLKRRYGNGLTLWHYQKEDYLFTEPTKGIPNYRLEKMKHCLSDETKTIKELLLEYKKAGYQEALISLYEKDVYENII